MRPFCSAGFLALSCFFAANLTASSIVLDQIGPNGSYTTGQEDYASQFVYNLPYQLGIEASAGLNTDQATHISEVDVAMLACIGGCPDSVFYTPHQNFADVTSWNVEIYSGQAAAENSLTGNVASLAVNPLQVGFIYDFSGVAVGSGVYIYHTALVEIPVNINLGSGSYYIAVVPSLDQSDYGQLGVLTTTYGNPENDGCQTANLPEFGTAVGCDVPPLAYRVIGSNPTPEPGTFGLIAVMGAVVLFSAKTLRGDRRIQS